MMENEEGKLTSELNEKIFQFFSEFMSRVTKFEELGDVGSGLLVSFQQGLEFLRRPPLGKSSELIERVIRANETRRLLSYLDAGCVNACDTVENIKLNTSLVGLLDHLNRVKCVVNELQCLLEDVTDIMHTASKSFPLLPDKDVGNESDALGTANDKEELVSSHLQKPGVTDYAAMMAIIYSMLKQEYMMQLISLL